MKELLEASRNWAPDTVGFLELNSPMLTEAVRKGHAKQYAIHGAALGPIKNPRRLSYRGRGKENVARGDSLNLRQSYTPEQRKALPVRGPKGYLP